MELHQKVAAARKNKGLTQEELADLTNITVRTVQRIESGASTPRSYTLKSIATALGVSFEELKVSVTDSSNSLNNSISTVSAPYSEESGRHFLQMLCLSCFSYLVLPFIHFLIPVGMLKNADEQNPKVIDLARRIVRSQLYWKSVLWVAMLLTLACNIIGSKYFQIRSTLNYLWPFFILYFVNAAIITSYLLQIKKADLSFQEGV